jgi:plasmid maintenance system antidote protein VapI
MARIDSHAAGLKTVATPHRITTHRGEALAEALLKPLGLSVNAFAMALRVPATRMARWSRGSGR